jgi:uncharacterized protein YgiB involved in biofilm formation
MFGYRTDYDYAADATEAFRRADAIAEVNEHVAKVRAAMMALAECAAGHDLLQRACDRESVRAYFSDFLDDCVSDNLNLSAQP